MQNSNSYNYNHLYYFYVIAKLEGVTSAAKYLNTSQSSLSTQLKTLESELGKNLFRKSGRKIELNESGKELFGYCRRAFEVFEEMGDQLNRKATSMGIRVTVGVSVDIERPFVADCLGIVSRAYRKEKRPLLNLLSLPSNQLMQNLRLGDVDFLLTTKVNVDSEIEVVEKFSAPVGLYGTRDLASAARGMSFIELVKSEAVAFVLPSKGTSFRDDVDIFLRSKRVNPICAFESNVIAPVIRAASDGLGVTLMPHAYVSREVDTGNLVPISVRPLFDHRFLLVCLKNRLAPEKKRIAVQFSEAINSVLNLRRLEGIVK